MCSRWSQEASQLDGKIHILVILSKGSLRCWYFPGLVAWENVSPAEERKNSGKRDPWFTFPRLVVMQLLCSASVLEQNMVMTALRSLKNGNTVCLIFGIHMDQKLLQDFSMACLKDLLLSAAVFMPLTWGVNWRKTDRDVANLAVQ